MSDPEFVCAACDKSHEYHAGDVMTECRVCARLHCSECVDEFGRCIECSKDQQSKLLRGTLDRIRILGEQVDDCIGAFEPYRNHASQRNRERALIETLRASLTRVQRLSYITEARLGVIFDVDGVLLDSYEMHFECWASLAAEDGIVIPESEFRSLFGRRGREIARQVWGPEFPEQQVVSIHRRKQALYRQSLQRNLPAMDGAVQLIDSLVAAGLVLAVGSSAPPANVKMTLEKLGRRQAFSAIVTGSDVIQGKPDPGVFLLAARRMGIEPSHCAVIEDAPVGIAAAVRGGMTAIALLGTAPAERFAQAHLVVNSLHQLSPKRIADLIQAQN